MGKQVRFWSVALSVLLLDRITKFLVVRYLEVGESIDVGFFSLTHVLNTGSAFGMFKGASVLLGILAAGVTIYILLRYSRFELKLQPVLGLVFAGALGNLIDRLYYGAVIDFINLHWWPVFNIADSAITVAIIWLLIEGKNRKV